MFSIVYVTAPASVAESIASSLVEKRLAACVNIIPQVTSIYTWEGKPEKSSESLMMIKSSTSLVDGIVDAVRKQHPYEVPEIISVPMGPGSAPYLEWIANSTGPLPPNPS